MDEKIKGFFKRINEESRWDREILNSLNKDCLENPTMKRLVYDYLSPEEVKEDEFNFETPEVYEEENFVEIQCENLGECGMTYFTIHPNLTEAEYKSNKMKKILKDIEEVYTLNYKKADEIYKENCYLLNAKGNITRYMVNFMTKEEFINDIKSAAEVLRKEIRYGQSVFNYIDSKYGHARTAVNEFKVDCFYNDSSVDDFIDNCWSIIERRKS